MKNKAHKAGFFERLAEDVLGKDARDIGKDFDAAAKKAEKAYVDAHVKGGELYEKYDGNDRAWAGTYGLKGGAIIGGALGFIFGGPAGMAIGAVKGAKVGGLAGVSIGHKCKQAHDDYIKRKTTEFSGTNDNTNTSEAHSPTNNKPATPSK